MLISEARALFPLEAETQKQEISDVA